MIIKIEALNYRCLEYISQDVKGFELLIGPNASGKTTFLDVIAFLSTMVKDGFESALKERSNSHEDLLFKKQGQGFELAVELKIPDEISKQIARKDLNVLRYEVSVGYDESGKGGFVIREEKVLLIMKKDTTQKEFDLFPYYISPPKTIMTRSGEKGTQILVSKVPHGNDNFSSEKYEKAGKGWVPSFKFGNLKSALGNLPADNERFPASNWLKEYLANGVQNFMLDSLSIRKASPPSKIRGFELNGSNLPWVVKRLKNNPERFSMWISHLQTALPELKNIKAVERPDDKYCYLVYEYNQGFEIPSWMVSDGTLRLTALTLPAYLPDSTGIFMVEEPENGIHPNAVQTVFDSLSSVYSGQVFLASHSPVILSLADPGSVLCFSKCDNGGTSIVRGSQHPQLKNWHGEISFEALFASGVLG